MSEPDFPFDAVVFDLDGTLVATDLFWPDAARAGALRAFAELGLEREPPTRAEWMSMVGYPIEDGFARVFADLEPAARAAVLEACLDEEHRALRAGRAALLPGAADLLETLRRRGVRLGIASNCGRDYLSAMVDGLGLARWIEEPRCLDSPGVSNKAEMIQDLLWTFGTRSAVMVGDRISDRDAAWANGLPHVHLARGFAEPGEVARCEAVIDGLDALLARLEGRTAWLGSIADRLGLGGLRSIAVVGGPASGKTLFARDLARLVRSRGREARVFPVHEGGPADSRSVEAHLADAPPDALTILEGRALSDPHRRAPADRWVLLEVPEELARRRLAARDVPGGLSAALPAALERAVDEPLRRAGAGSAGAADEPDLRIPAANPLGVDPAE